MPRLASLLLLGALGLSACIAPSKAQRVQEAAYELNMISRFGRVEAVLDKVLPEERSQFIARHQNWHGQLRIVDLELAGIGFPKSDEADVFVNVGWQPANMADMRSTVVRQRWKDQKGTWLLISEERAQGDIGLFGEPSAEPQLVSPPSQTARSNSYRTTVIR